MGEAESGASALEAKTSSGWTALHLAARYGHAETVKALGALGVSLDPDGDHGAGLMGMVGKMCYGEGAEESRAATVEALEQLGCRRRWAQVASDVVERCTQYEAAICQGYGLQGDRGLKLVAEVDG